MNNITQNLSNEELINAFGKREISAVLSIKIPEQKKYLNELKKVKDSFLKFH